MAFTRTSPIIATRLERAIIAELEEGRVPTFKTHLNERAAYKALFTYKCALDELDPKIVNGVPQARENAAQFAAEVVELVIARKEAA